MDDKEAAKDMLNDKDSSIRKMGEDELINIQKKEEEIQNLIKKSLIPIDPKDSSNIFLKLEQEQEGMKLQFFLETYFACTQNMPSQTNGKLRL